MTEQWKPIIGFEGIYEISSSGRIKRILRSKGCKNEFLAGRQIWTGYTQVILQYCGKYRRAYLHVLVMENFVGPKNGLQVNHKNGDKSDNRLENLEYMTSSENHLHAYRVLGRKAKGSPGEKNGSAKLTKCQISEIRRLYSTNEFTQQQLADQFKVKQAHISRIILRQSWT